MKVCSEFLQSPDVYTSIQMKSVESHVLSPESGGRHHPSPLALFVNSGNLFNLLDLNFRMLRDGLQVAVRL